MTEKVYVLNEKGEVLGLQDRQEVHKNGTFHAGVQCWLMNSKDKQKDYPQHSLGQLCKLLPAKRKCHH